MGSQLAEKYESGTNSRVFLFEEAYKYFHADRSVMREMLGGKGAGLAEMSATGVPVPPGLTILTLACRQYYSEKGRMPQGLVEEAFGQLARIESKLDRRLGDVKKPLLLSVRSGAKFSMPGMMDTILNLGLNDETVLGLVALTKNERFAWDSYRRFIQMYSSVVLEINKDSFEKLIERIKHKYGVTSDSALSVQALQELVENYKLFVQQEKGLNFPQNTRDQLAGAVEAVFRSWNNTRAIYYRNLNKIDHNIGTAVNVQAMVFGNFDDNSATGVCFTRNPSNGEKVLYGEYLVNAQGEDVVAGIRTPRKIAELGREMPVVYEELLKTVQQLEKHYQDIQDIEFTVEQGRLFILQTRNGKRTAQAAVKVAVDMAEEGIITRQEAIKRIEPTQLNQLLLPSFSGADKERARDEGRYLAHGLNASPGAAIGQVIFNPDEVERLNAQGHKVILVRHETCPDDIHGIVSARGVLTSRGGMTSHAAVVARGMGKPCVAGCEELSIDYDKELFKVGNRIVRKGDLISIDGSTGQVFSGEIETLLPQFGAEFLVLLEWADDIRRLRVRTNADTPEDAERARSFGAEGIGLCRTEHMFMDPARLPVVREMILAGNDSERQAALDKLLPMQREDFIGIFRAMHGLPVTIRLLDPPLHEFLPRHDELLEEIITLKAAGQGGADLRLKEVLLRKVRELKEANPMMGLRGCRLGLCHPEINRMQVRAIFEAAIHVKREGLEVLPEIMIPLVGHEQELRINRDQLETEAKAVMQREGVQLNYKFGTMIEIPRACVTAAEIAQHAEFFSFGTNDLTQMTFGFSRDDAEGKFLQRYLEGVEDGAGKTKILADNPFEVLDRKGVGELMRMAVQQGRRVKPDLKLGICGEHGGEPSSIAFAHELGLTYVSCSPYRVPIARLAAAQATLNLGSQSSRTA